MRLYRGFLRGLFDADGHIEGASTVGGVSVRLTSIDLATLQAVQRMLARLGIRTSIRVLKDEQVTDWGERGGKYFSQRSYRLIATGANAARYMEAVGFLNSAKAEKWDDLTSNMSRGFYRKPYTATVESVEPDGREDVYDVAVADVHAFDGNAIVLHNCGEIALSPTGAGVLRHVHLDHFASKKKGDRVDRGSGAGARAHDALPNLGQRPRKLRHRLV
ncbi:LAGLIDADG family homing endonuclease [Streptomyces sp. NPDC031705]|uniref:LAGLIDADG family homing endonuclease n=1 Tax=Streptomyces sp. NPDC031705 TaxID=3155729 RepID=UPI0034065EB1